MSTWSIWRVEYKPDISLLFHHSKLISSSSQVTHLINLLEFIVIYTSMYKTRAKRSVQTRSSFFCSTVLFGLFMFLHFFLHFWPFCTFVFFYFFTFCTFVLSHLVGQCIWTSMQNLKSVAQKMSELWVLCTFVLCSDCPYKLPCKIWSL